MTQPLPYGMLDAVAPDPSKTYFPAPKLVRQEGNGIVSVSESFNLSGTLLPGQWLLVDCEREFGWQIRAGNFLTGATVVPIGDPLLVAVFKIRIWTNVDAQYFRKLLKTVLRKPVGLSPFSTTSAAHGIDQPQLVDLGVKNVVVKSITPLMNPLVESGGRGAWTSTCKFLEYRPPIAALPTPSTVYPDKAPPTPSATDNIAKENAALAATVKEKAAALVAAVSGGPTP
jgi:hypothetical protein